MTECIVNPSARSGRDRQILEDLKTAFAARNIPIREHFTDGPGAALRIAGELTGEGKEGGKLTLVVLGGDGTLNEVISGIRDFSALSLGYIPTGSGNDFARGIDLPKDTRVLIDRILAGKEIRRMDVGRLVYHSKTRTLSRLHDENISDIRQFIVSSGIGFDAAVCEEALSSGTKAFFNRIGLGKLTYGSIAIRHLLKAPRIPVDIDLDGDRHIHLDHFLFAAAMNTPFEGGGFRFAPDADPADGLLNLCVAGEMSKPAMLCALPRAYFGKHYGIPGICHEKASVIRIRTELPMWVHTDGEVMMKSDDIELTCLPQVLSLIV